MTLNIRLNFLKKYMIINLKYLKSYSSNNENKVYIHKKTLQKF